MLSTKKHFGDISSYLSDAVADTTNMIQTMESDGFQIGTGANVNQTGNTFYWFGFGGALPLPPGSGSFTMAQGSYVGTGSGFAVTGTGFTPDLVMIKHDGANYAVFRIRQMSGDVTAYFAAASADFTGGITSLDSDGFSVGTSAVVNTASNTYQWQAFGNAYGPDKLSGAADFATGLYYGNAIDNRSIPDMPFQPDLVAIKRNSTTAGTFRSSAHSGDLSSLFSAGSDAANIVQSLGAEGFEVGTNAAVNTSGSLYRWFAFKKGSNFDVGSYTGSGTSGQQVAVPFWSDEIWVKRSTAVAAVQRPSTLAGDVSQGFLNTANTSNMISGINASGFQLGTNTAVNTAGGAYRYAVWRAPPSGSVGVDVVDTVGTPVDTPTFTFQGRSRSFGCNSSAATLGSASQKIRLSNMSADAQWSLTMAPTDGDSAVWENASSTRFYDFNDPSGSPSGCQDGGDADVVAGSMSIDPSVGSIAPQSGCTTDNITLGSADSFSAATTAITLMTAAIDTNTECYWDLSQVDVTQSLPAQQPADDYSIRFTLTAVAY